MKNYNYQISVPEPCHEDWNSMSANEKGAFCSKCCKTVIDFTNKTNDEILDIIRTSSQTSVCGRFSNTQLNTESNTEMLDISLPVMATTNFKQVRHFTIALMLVFGSTLFSCTTTSTDNGSTIIKTDSVSINNADDSVKVNDVIIMGEAAIMDSKDVNTAKMNVEKPSCENSTPSKEKMTLGQTKVVEVDNKESNAVTPTDTTKLENAEVHKQKDLEKEYPIMGRVAIKH